MSIRYYLLSELPHMRLYYIIVLNFIHLVRDELIDITFLM